MSFGLFCHNLSKFTIFEGLLYSFPLGEQFSLTLGELFFALTVAYNILGIFAKK